MHFALQFTVLLAKGLLLFVTDVRAGQGTSVSLECQVIKDVEIVFHEWNFYPSNPGIDPITNINRHQSGRFVI